MDVPKPTMLTPLPPSPAADSTVLYLLRHAATDHNLAQPPRLQGRSADVALSPEGRWQAQRCAELLASVRISAFLSSPLQRARETAEIVAGPHQSVVETIDALLEVDVGHWEGRSWQEISQSEPQAYQRFMETPATHGYEGGENTTQVLERVRPAFEQLGRRFLGNAIVVVGHNVVNRVWLSHVMGIPLNSARSINQDNAGVNVVRHHAGKMRLLSLNITTHLWTVK